MAFASLVVSLGLLATLLAQAGLFSGDVGSPDRPEGLTTLALVLAILAFLVQIFVFVFQTRDSGASLQRSEELNAMTQSLLSKIEANSDTTRKVLFSQFDRLLDYVVGRQPKRPKGTGPAPIGEVLAGEKVDGDLKEERPATVADMQKIMGEMVSAATRPVFTEPSPVGSPSDEDMRVVNYMQSWPTPKEAEAAVGELTRLSPLALAVLTRTATVEVVQRLAGERVGLLKSTNVLEALQELTALALIRDEGDWTMLTDRGRELARALPVGKSDDDRPDWYDEILSPLIQSG